MTKRSHFLGAGITAALLLALHVAPGQTVAPHWNVLEAGAKPDGQIDNTAIFQKLLNDAGKAGGGVVEVPAGRYCLKGNLSIPANVTLQGIYRVPPTPGRLKESAPNGSVLLAYAGRGSAAGPPFIRLAGNNAALAGLVIAYPEWKQTEVPPVPYPPCVLADGPENVGICDCCLLNPYEALKLVRAARHLVRNVTGYPSKRGIYVDECYDIGHIENVHFWPFGVSYQPEDPYCKWVNTQGVAFELARTDWHYIHNTFCFGYGVGYKFSKSSKGSANGNFLGLGADSCRRAVLVEQAQAPGLLISNGEFVGRWSSTDSVCLEIGPEVEGTVSLVNCSFWGPIERCVWMRSPVGQFTASACHFLEWDNAGSGAPAIQLEAGRTIVQACTFNQSKLQVAVGTNVTSAILTANQAEGGFRVRNDAGKRTQMAVNEQDTFEWAAEAKSHYLITVGARGDARYLETWHGPEQAARPFRWSGSASRLLLPVLPGKPYALTLDLSAPAQAVSAGAGLYWNGKQLAPLTNGSVLKATLPPVSRDTIELELRTKGWVPQQVMTGSGDPRVLGVQVFDVRMKAEGAAEPIFDANTGKWLEPHAKDAEAAK
ncbi:MAG TPA: glycosyl hydrolase family 28-related protein [Bacillota bacterium]|nr:glycosyl hydrolase family 28-related protein [Bacillota bacterium]